jgi:flagella basal body P-ring formation protein FlgA
MRLLLSCLIIGMFILFPGGAEADELTITVAAEAILPGPHITLGEVATISGADQARIETLKELNLGNAPYAGRSVVLSMETFGARLLNKGVDLTGITWEVPPYVKITSEHQVLTGENIAARAKDYLIQQFTSKAPADLSIEQIGQQNDLILPPGAITLKPRLTQGIRSNTAVDIDVLVNETIINTVRPRFQVTLYEEVAVTAKPIGAGSILTLENLRLERRDVARSTRSTEYITDLNKVLGLAARRSLGAGLVLDVSSLVRPDIIKRADPVTIIAQRGGIEVTTAGIALQDGYEGQIIRVQNQKTKKIITAKVVNADTVKVLIHGGR